jgi:ABC-type bacteriocin/lantibiotic exporter with double-glycine peptidase domain
LCLGTRALFASAIAFLAPLSNMDSMSNSNPGKQRIELRGVTKVYACGAVHFQALDNVTLALPAGEFTAVVGKSGSGKSTLVNLIAGIDRPSSGEVLVGGTRVHELDESRLATWLGAVEEVAHATGPRSVAASAGMRRVTRSRRTS